MKAPEPALLRQGLAAARRCALRLRRSLNQLQAFFPLEATEVEALTPARQDQVDAFLKRFEQLLLTLQDQVFVGLAHREGREPREMSRRDVAELMERLRAIPSARQFRDMVGVRNRLTHLYPDDPTRQAAILNEAYTAAPHLLLATDQVIALVARQGDEADPSG